MPRARESRAERRGVAFLQELHCLKYCRASLFDLNEGPLVTNGDGLTINGRFLTQRMTGVQRYAREITLELDQLLKSSPFREGAQAELIVPAGSKPDVALRAISIKETRLGGGPLWTQFVLPFAKQGVLLSLGNIGPVLALKQIICIHDLNTLLVPESYSRAFRLYYRAALAPLARNAARVVTVSNFSAAMLDKFGLRRREEIAVIPNGHEHVKNWRPERSAYAAKGENQRPFVFVLGSRAVHKNVEMLFSIAQELDALGLDIWVAGASGGYFSAVDKRPAPPNVRMLGFVTDDDLAALYGQALCFAFPSLTEGFGLPVLEAMTLGCPVVASNAASLPEVCGDAGLLADPKSSRNWLNQIGRLAADPGLVRDLRAKGVGQAQRFSWKTSAKAYLDLIAPLTGLPARPQLKEPPKGVKRMPRDSKRGRLETCRWLQISRSTPVLWAP
jgi:glycosyltransferase involved in cell wall biosynthesis